MLDRYCQTSFMEDIGTSAGINDTVSSYDFLYVNANADWVLNPYARLAESLLAILRSRAPYDFIKYLLQWAKGLPSSSERRVKATFFVYNSPYTAATIVSFVFAIALAIIGMLYCYLLFQRKKNFSPEAKSLRTGHNWQYFHIVCLGILAVFLVMSGMSIVLGRRRFEEGVSLTQTLVQNAFKNLLEFQNKTFANLQFILVRELDKTCDQLVESVNEFSRTLFNAVQDMTSSSTTSVNTLSALSNKFPNLNVSFHRVFEEFVEAQRSYKDVIIAFESHVHELNDYLFIAKNFCMKNTALYSTGICQSPELNPKVFLFVNLTALPRVSELLEISVSHLLEQNLTNLASILNSTTSIYAEKVLEKTMLRRSDLERTARLMKEHRDITLKSFEDLLLHRVNEEVSAYSTQALALFSGDGVIGRVDKAVSFVIKLAAVGEFLSGILLAFGGLLGIYVTVFADSEWFSNIFPRMVLPRMAYGITRCVLLQLFLFSVPIMVLFGIMVGICGSLTQTCIGLKDDSILKIIGDDVDIWGGRLLGLTNVIHIIPKDTTLVKVVKVCGQSENSTIWHATGVNKALDFKDKFRMSMIDDPVEFFNLGRLFDEGGVAKSFFLFRKNAQIFSDRLKALNVSVGYEGILLTANMTEYRTNLTLFSKMLEQYDLNFGRTFSSWVRTSTDTLSGLVYTATIRRDRMQRIANDVIKRGEDAIAKLNRAVASVNATESLVNEMKKDFINRTRKVLCVIDKFLDHVNVQLNQNIGKCEFISEVYTKGRLIYCSYIVSGLNAIWLSLGIVTLMFAVSLHSFVKLVHYFRHKILEDGENLNGMMRDSVICLLEKK